MAGFSIKINQSETEKVLSKALQDMLRQKIKEVVRESRKTVILIFYQTLLESDTFQNLTDHWGLQGDLGVQTYYVLETVKTISQMINLETIPPRAKDLGGIKVTLIRENLGAILESPYAQYETSNGQTIPWLEWLLTEGSNVVVQDYAVAAEENPGQYSRTGALIMIPHSGYGFSIDESNAGTINDNWITRAAAMALPRIEKFLMEGLRNG